MPTNIDSCICESGSGIRRSRSGDALLPHAEFDVQPSYRALPGRDAVILTRGRRRLVDVVVGRFRLSLLGSAVEKWQRFLCVCVWVGSYQKRISRFLSCWFLFPVCFAVPRFRGGGGGMSREAREISRGRAVSA